jgi:hypothetical protein
MATPSATDLFLIARHAKAMGNLSPKLKRVHIPRFSLNHDKGLLSIDDIYSTQRPSAVLDLRQPQRLVPGHKFCVRPDFVAGVQLRESTVVLGD